MQTSAREITDPLFFAQQNHRDFVLCPAKLWSNADFAPQSYGAMQTLPREITEPLFFAPQNYGDFVLCPSRLWSNADFAPQNRGDIVSGAKKKSSNLIVVSFF